MSQQNTMEDEDAQTKDLNSDQQATLKTKSAFRRRAPLAISPKPQDAVAVVTPMQQDDRIEPAVPVSSDVSTPETSTPSTIRRLEEAIADLERRYRERLASMEMQSSTRFKPFSFDKRDAAQRVKREKGLKAIRQRQQQLLKRRSTFKAHPVRRYKPMVQPPTQSNGPADN